MENCSSPTTTPLNGRRILYTTIPSHTFHTYTPALPPRITDRNQTQGMRKSPIFSGDLTPEQASTLIDQWISKASRSRIDAFVKVTRTIRTTGGREFPKPYNPRLPID